MNMDDLKLSDLKEEHRMVAEIIGLEAYMKLCEAFGGADICIPSHHHLYVNYYNRKIIADLGKYSNKELAKIYPVSLSTVYNIRRNADTSIGKNMPDNFSIQDLKPHFQDMAEVIGFEKFLALCNAYPANTLYIPTVREAAWNYIKRKIIENKDIFSKKELARMYNVSYSTVHNILKKQGK